MLQAVEYHKSTHLSDFQKTLQSNLQTRLAMNQLVFRQYMPNVISQLKSNKKTRFTATVTRFDVVNVTDAEHGTVLYGENPVAASDAHVSNFLRGAPTKTFGDHKIEPVSLIPEYAQVALRGSVPQCKLPLSEVPDAADTIVMLGLGLGHSLRVLLQRKPPRNLVVYEPNIDLLLASLQVLDWAEIFELTEKKQTRLFLQSGADGSTLPEDMKELRKAVGAETFYFYRHYPCVSLDKAFAKLFGLKGPGNENKVPVQACLSRQVAGKEKAQRQSEAAQQTFKQNSDALSSYDNQTAAKVKRAKAVRWQGYISRNGGLNALDTATAWPLYSDCPDISLEMQGQARSEFDYQNPAIVELPASISQGKLRNWHYNKVIKRAAFRRQKAVESFPEQEHQRPSFIPGHLVVGWGLGYGHSEWLNQNADFRLALVYEADIELFALSLGTKAAEKLLAPDITKAHRLLIWVDVAPSGIQEQVLNAFRTPKGYVFGAMQWHTTMRRTADIGFAERMLNALQNIPLKLVSLDDFRFTLNHTAANIEQNAKFLRESKHKIQQTVAIVGNGPSLNNTQLEWLRDNRERLLIVSCGTSLFTLYQAKIQPDFHAEGEINRATFDWVNSIDDKAYLKGIKVLGTSGLHPATGLLFADQLLAFKADDHATNLISRLSGFEKDCLKVTHAFPTVSNFALSILLSMGAQHVVMLGVDFALSDDNKHHAENSVYAHKQLTDKQSGFDPQKLVSGSFNVPGNFRHQVVTKFEFKLAVDAMSALISAHSRVKIENMSDGAKIPGAVPVGLNQLKLISPPGLFDTSSFKPVDRTLQASLQALSWRKIVEVLEELAALRVEEYVNLSRSEIFSQTEELLNFVLSMRSEDGEYSLSALKDLVALACAYRAMLACYVDYSEVLFQVGAELKGLIRGINITGLLGRELSQDLQAEPFRLDDTTLNFL